MIVGVKYVLRNDVEREDLLEDSSAERREEESANTEGYRSGSVRSRRHIQCRGLTNLGKSHVGGSEDGKGECGEVTGFGQLSGADRLLDELLEYGHDSVALLGRLEAHGGSKGAEAILVIMVMQPWSQSRVELSLLDGRGERREGKREG